jgi:hypothetical protein
MEEPKKYDFEKSDRANLNGVYEQYAADMARLDSKVTALEKVLEKGLSSLTYSIEQLAGGIMRFSAVQEKVVMRIIIWMMAMCSLVIITLLGIRLSEVGVLKVVLGL